MIAKNELLQNLSLAIDQTLLKPDATEANYLDFFKLCNLHKFFGACFPSSYLELATKHLSPTIKKVTVIGFPHGNNHFKSKLHECAVALEAGADEVDMVFAIGQFLGKNLVYVENEISQIANMVNHFKKDRLLKVIVESSYLKPDQIADVTKLIGQTGAHFIKTSTGFASGGATIESVSIMKLNAPKHLWIKASGGIKTRQQAIAYIEAGAVRLGTSSGVDICASSGQNSNSDTASSNY
jgi:deoxyribose-phosphate aldolase